MTEETTMTAPFRKISVRIWTPLLERFSQRIDSACLRRDAYLSKVLEDELDELDADVSTPNSEAARSFIAAHLDTVPRKLVTLTLPEELVRKLDTICEAKNLIRDTFFNRLFFLLVADYRHVTRLFFDGDENWFQDLLERTDFSSSAAGDLLDPIPDYRSPFQTIREGLWVAHDRLNKDPGTAESPDDWLRQHKIYSVTITDPRFGKGDLYGLSTYLPDTLVPGTSDHAAVAALLDEL